MKIGLIDNYDSFTFNLKQYISEISDVQLEIFRNDEKSVRDLSVYDKLIISPGPGLPGEAGICEEAILNYAASKPILGVCLGLQSIVTAFGGKLLNLYDVHHGVSSEIFKTEHENGLFDNMTAPFQAGRYHSWVADPAFLPEELLVTAKDKEGVIMAIRHKVYPLYGVQFHPESILTPEGKTLLQNFLKF